MYVFTFDQDRNGSPLLLRLASTTHARLMTSGASGDIDGAFRGALSLTAALEDSDGASGGDTLGLAIEDRKAVVTCNRPLQMTVT